MAKTQFFKVYVDGGTVVKNKETYILKKEYEQFTSKQSADVYYEKLKGKGQNPVMEIRQYK